MQTAADDPRRRWTAIRNILHLTETLQITSDNDCSKLCHGFAQFFVEKIHRIKDTIKARLGDTLDDPLHSDVRHPGPMFVGIQSPSVDEVYRLTALRHRPTGIRYVSQRRRDRANTRK